MTLAANAKIFISPGFDLNQCMSTGKGVIQCCGIAEAECIRLQASGTRQLWYLNLMKCPRMARVSRIREASFFDLVIPDASLGEVRSDAGNSVIESA